MPYCPACQKLKPLDAFSKNRTKPKGHHSYCRECVRDQRREKYHYPVVKKRGSLKHQYGLSWGVYRQLATGQNNVCAICGEPETKIHKGSVRFLSVDHDHQTNAIRGLLCYRCNSLLGLAQDQTELLKACIDYLHKHQSQEPQYYVTGAAQHGWNQHKPQAITRPERQEGAGVQLRLTFDDIA